MACISNGFNKGLGSDKQQDGRRMLVPVSISLCMTLVLVPVWCCGGRGRSGSCVGKSRKWRMRTCARSTITRDAWGALTCNCALFDRSNVDGNSYEAPSDGAKDLLAKLIQPLLQPTHAANEQQTRPTDHMHMFAKMKKRLKTLLQ
eukprot:4466289-Amphidinium_carterae.3